MAAEALSIIQSWPSPLRNVRTADGAAAGTPRRAAAGAETGAASAATTAETTRGVATVPTAAAMGTTSARGTAARAATKPRAMASTREGEGKGGYMGSGSRSWPTRDADEGTAAGRKRGIDNRKGWMTCAGQAAATQAILYQTLTHAATAEANATGAARGAGGATGTTSAGAAWVATETPAAAAARGVAAGTKGTMTARGEAAAAAPGVVMGAEVGMVRRPAGRGCGTNNLPAWMAGSSGPTAARNGPTAGAAAVMAETPAATSRSIYFWQEQRRAGTLTTARRGWQAETGHRREGLQKEARQRRRRRRQRWRQR